MSMSQEEIEALMSGAGDIAEPEEELNTEETLEEPVIEDIPDEQGTVTSDAETNIDDMLAGIDGIVDDGTETSASDTIEDVNNEDIDALLSGIDGIVDDEPKVETTESSSSSPKKEDKGMEKMIDNNQYPLPASNENKVVNQLNEVADDSEEKASQIFDVLSFILDENNEISSYNKSMGDFIAKQEELLESLSVKFPNIAIFKDNLETAKELSNSSKDLASKVDGENNKIFEAMELMQYHDINRQKIERVMAVIRKLNSYLNGIFEDDNDRPEVQIAKHISGDSNEIVGSEDIESLISEFSNEG